MSAPVPAGAQPAGYVGRVTSVVVWKLDEARFLQLTPSRRAALQASGIVVLEQERALQSPELGLAGHWLAFRNFGKRRYSTDADGYVRLPSRPVDITQVKVFQQVRDKSPIGVLNAITLVPEGQAPPAAVLRLVFEPAADMNPPLPPEEPVALGSGWALRPASHRAMPPPPPRCDKRRRCAPLGSPSGNAAPGCCLDYDGTEGDGEPYLRSGNCGALGYLNFYDSTCFRWTFVKASRPCLRERAILQVEGPTCWINHKYRNCQSLDEDDFHLAPAEATIEYGQPLILRVRNNTPGNSTCLGFLARPARAGKLERSSPQTRMSSAAQCGGYELEHFNDTQRKHYEDLTVRFRGRKPPRNVCEETYLIGADSAGRHEEATVTVTDPACQRRAELSGTITYSYSESGSETVPIPHGSVQTSGRYTITQKWVIDPSTTRAQGNGRWSAEATWTVDLEGSSSSDGGVYEAGMHTGDCKFRIKQDHEINLHHPGGSRVGIDVRLNGNTYTVKTDSLPSTATGTSHYTKKLVAISGSCSNANDIDTTDPWTERDVRLDLAGSVPAAGTNPLVLAGTSPPAAAPVSRQFLYGDISVDDENVTVTERTEWRVTLRR